MNNKMEYIIKILFLFTVILNVLLNILGYWSNIIKIIVILILIGVFLYLVYKENKYKEKMYYLYYFVVGIIFAENIYAFCKII
jgi:hypothetical protein